MKLLGYGLMAVGIGWAVFLMNREPSLQGGQGPIALLLGIGFGLVTAHSVGTGSIRGAQRRVHRAEQPGTFWSIVAIRVAVVMAMLSGALKALVTAKGPGWTTS